MISEIIFMIAMTNEPIVKNFILFIAVSRFDNGLKSANIKLVRTRSINTVTDCLAKSSPSQ